MREAAEGLLGADWKLAAVPELKAALKGLPVSYAAGAVFARKSGVLISLGGDGTLLGAARLAAPLKRPVLSVNLGGLGFMTAVGPEHVGQKLPKLLSTDGEVELRGMVRVELWRGTKRALVLDALNDIALARASAGRMARFQASVDGQFLAEFRADGLVFASPTGSTAYALSVGGPIIDARTPVNLLALVSPHTLSNRPLVLPASSRLQVLLPEAGLGLSTDGAKPMTLKAGDRLVLGSAPYQARLILAKARDPWAVLRNKLGWQGLGPKGVRRA